MSGHSTSPLPITADTETLVSPRPTQCATYQLAQPFKLSTLTIAEVEVQASADLILSIALVDEDYDLYIEALSTTSWADNLQIKESVFPALVKAGIVVASSSGDVCLANFLALQAGI
jgi:hypothetical protein